MQTKKELIKYITKLEKDLKRLKEEIESLDDRTVTLEGKFPKLNSIDSALIEEAEGLFEKEFSKELNDSN